MNNPCVVLNRRPSRRLPILTASILAASAPWIAAANPDVWNNFSGVQQWSVGSNWLDLSAPLTGDPTADLTFGGTTAYTANNDLVGLFLNTLTLNATVAETISGNSLDFRTDDTGAGITQSGSGAFTISAPIIATNPLTLDGNGTGLVSLTGLLSGGGLLTKSGSGTFFLNNPANTYSGGTTITGGVLEISTNVANGSVDLPAAANSVLGNGGAVTINGGELKITQNGTGSILSTAAARPITFGASGGTLNLNGRINNNAAATFSLVLTPGGTTPVVKFNGGPIGISSNVATDGNWALSPSNSLRFSALTGASATTPIIFEVTNGALMDMFNFDSFPGALTLRGVSLGAGGDATGQGTEKNTGRFVWNNGIGTPATYTLNAGIFLEDALQTVSANGLRRIDANITARGTASGHAAQADISGRGTGTAIVAPQAFPLIIGGATNNGRTLTVENGGTVLLDNRNRTDQNNQNGVQVTSLTDILGGGTMKLVQSWTGTGALAPAARPVGYIEFLGDIRGNGTAASESVLEVQVPFRNGSSAVTNTGGATFNAAGAAGADLIVNGSNAGEGGGLRITAVARNTRGFTANNGASTGLAFADTGADNLAKLNGNAANSIAGAARLAALTGSGGYLTIAPSGATFPFPAGGEWSNAVTVGLKVIDSNTTGDDVSLSTGFLHNINVTAGATLNAGGNILGPAVATADLGLIKGTGSITGGVTIAAGATLAPGFSIGTLTVGNITLNGTFQYEATNAPTSDLLIVNGNLTLGGTSALSLPGGNTYATADYTLATYTGALVGTFGIVPALPANFTLDYGTGANSLIKLLYNAPTDIWDGTIDGNWNTTTANWKTLATYADLHKVVIDDTAAGPNTNIVINAGNVSPFSVTVNNGGVYANYSITGSAGNAIIGSGSLTKNGTGTLTLSGPHTYSGGTNVNNGTLKLGASDSLPDVGVVAVAGAGTLDTQANSDTVASLSVDGAVIGTGTLTTAALALGNGATFAANLVLAGDAAKIGAGAGAVVSGGIDLGGGTRTFNVAAGTAPDLTLSGAVSNGSLTKSGNGVMVLGAANPLLTGTTTVNGGTLRTGVAGALPAGGSVSVAAAGTLNLNGIFLSLASLNSSGNVVSGGAALTTTSLSGAGGTIDLGGGAFLFDSGSYAGAFAGAGTTVTKQNAGIATLTGTSTHTGGTFVNGGRLNASGTPGGTLGVTVNAGAVLQFTNTVTGPVHVNAGGTLSTTTGSNPVNGDLFIDGTSAMHLYDEGAPASASDFALGGASPGSPTGTLRGSGNFTLSSNQAGADGGIGLRLRSTIASDYSGTITVGNAAKLELNSNTTGAFSPMGTGKVIVTAGTTNTPGSLLGTYSQIQTRTNVTGTTTYGNNVEITGTGAVNFNVLGAAATTAVMGDLKIGAGQSMFFNKNDAATDRTVAFQTVTLTGGNATFSVYDRNFRDNVTGTTSVGPNVQLGAIGESSPGAGAIFKAQGADTAVGPFPHVTITGLGSYTGLTDIQTGILGISATGSIATSSEIKLSNALSKLDVLAFGAGGYTISPAQKVSGIGDWDGRLVLDGTLAPGNSIGAITGDNLTLDGGGIMQFELSAIDNTSDLLNLSGSFDKGSAGAFLFDFEAGGVSGQTYTLVNFLGTTFAAADFNYTDLGPGLAGTFVVNPNNLQIVVAAVPEPGSIVSLIGGLAVLLGLRRSRRRA